MNNKSLLNQFSAVAIIEGISYLILLFIAMPLKYWGDKPEYVKWVGQIHGILTLIFVVYLVLCHVKYKWHWIFSLKGFILSILPFGAFIFEKELKQLK